jgi:septum formation protein
MSKGAVHITFILASESPRRRALLKQAGIPCIAVSSGADETLPGPLTPGETVTLLARRKADAAQGLLDRYCPGVIIAADTVVYINGQVLGKPSDRREAEEMLSALQGNMHTVYTGVALSYLPSPGAEILHCTFTSTANVWMRTFSQKEIGRYAATGEPDDKAGAYGVQGLGATLIERVEGDYHTVVGLPLAGLCEALKAWDVDYTECWL